MIFHYGKNSELVSLAHHIVWIKLRNDNEVEEEDNSSITVICLYTQGI
jgi:hypothetical protein